jgi:hypothetical protein
VLASRDHYAAFRTRRVIIKTRLIKLAGQGLKGARALLRYLSRDGATWLELAGEGLVWATSDHVTGSNRACSLVNCRN